MNHFHEIPPELKELQATDTLVLYRRVREEDGFYDVYAVRREGEYLVFSELVEDAYICNSTSPHYYAFKTALNLD